jgi:hypothetical protein
MLKQAALHSTTHVHIDERAVSTGDLIKLIRCCKLLCVHFRTLCSVSLRDCGLGDAHAAELCILLQLPRIDSLDVSSNDLGGRSGRAMLEGMEVHHLRAGRSADLSYRQLSACPRRSSFITTGA